MSVIIRLQNLPWSANALDIRNFFRGLSIPEGGVHIVGGEQGDAFIAFSTDEDARQGMMNDGGKIKEIQVKLLLSSRSEMHKVIEAARQSVPLLQLQPMQPVAVTAAPPALTPFASALGSVGASGLANIPGLGNPLEAPPQPAVIEVPPPSPPELDKPRRDRSDRRVRSRSKSRDRDKKDRPKKDRRDRSRSRDRSRERRRRERSRSRSRDRRDRKRDRKERSRSRDRSRDLDIPRRSRDRRNEDRRLNDNSQDSITEIPSKPKEGLLGDNPFSPPFVSNMTGIQIPANVPQLKSMSPFTNFGNGPMRPMNPETINRPNYGVPDPKMAEALNRLQELGNKRNPNAFQGAEANGPPRFRPERPILASQNERPGFGARNERPAFGGNREERPPFGNRDSPFGVNREGPPFGNREDHPPFNNRDERPNFGNRDERPPFANREERPPFANRDERPVFNNRDERPPFASRDERQPFGGREERSFQQQPPFSVRRDGRPSRFDTDNQNSCVVIRNVPTHASYGDVRRFFHGQLIGKHGIKMINDNNGRRSGTIYVRFCEPRDKQAALSRKDNELKDQQVIVEHLDDAEYEAAVDSYLPVRDDDDDVESSKSLVMIDQEEPSPAPFTVLRLTDLPNYAKEHDIIKKFSEFSLLSIMLVECRENKSKTAYVQFVKPEDAKIALNQREKYIFGRKPVHVSPCTEQDYELEKANQPSDISGPPAKENNSQVEKVIEPELELEPEPEPEGPRDPRQRRPTPRVDNKPAAAAPNFFPSFPNSGFPGAGFPSPYPGRFPVPISGDPRGPWGQRVPFNNGGVPRKHTFNLVDEEPHDCVLVKGLPPHATDRSIVDFFADADAVPARIHLMLDSSGRPSGDCFCEFRSTQEARLAAGKRGSELDGRKISVDLVSRKVVEEALEGPKTIEPERHDSLLGDRPLPLIRDFPPHAGEFNTRGFYRGRGGFDRGRGGFDRGRGGFDRGRGGFDRGRGGFDRGRGGFDRGRGGWDQRGRARGRGRGFPRGRGGFDHYNGHDDREDRDIHEDTGPEDFGAPGCVVSLENVPFRSGVEEILEFFSDFEINQDDIIRRFNDAGMPTGDARVAFRTPFDAQRAVKTHHMSVIRDRPIALQIL